MNKINRHEVCIVRKLHSDCRVFLCAFSRRNLPPTPPSPDDDMYTLCDMRAGTKAPGQKSMPVDVDNTGKEIDGQVTFPALSTLYIEPKLYFMKSI